MGFIGFFVKLIFIVSQAKIFLNLISTMNHRLKNGLISETSDAAYAAFDGCLITCSHRIHVLDKKPPDDKILFSTPDVCIYLIRGGKQKPGIMGEDDPQNVFFSKSRFSDV